MLFKIAWRNIWRNKLRSIVIMSSVAIGLLAGLFIISFSWGMNKENVHNVIQTQLAHIQIHNPSFQADKMVEYTIENGNDMVAKLTSDARVKAVAGRNIVQGMIASATSASGVNINGIKPDEEKRVSTISTSVIAGSYFAGDKKNEIMIGEKLATELGAKLKSKLVLTFQSKDGNITSGSFRVTAIYRTKNSAFDETNVYVKFDDIAALLSTGNELHEIAVLLKNDDDLEPVATDIRKMDLKTEVQTWKQLSPELQLIVDSFYQYMYIFMAIILMGLMFGIINTMLMAVLERQREVGMLMAIGMSKPRVFGMIVLETIFLTCIGIPLGMLLTYLTVEYFNKTGIDVSAFSKGMAMYGYPTVIHPELESYYYLPVSLMTAGAALLSGIYPAIKALQLKPAVSIRKI